VKNKNGKNKMNIDKNEPFVIETDITEEEHDIIEASRKDYKNNPESFVNLADLG
jgi:hypothetical protein